MSTQIKVNFEGEKIKSGMWYWEADGYIFYWWFGERSPEKATAAELEKFIKTVKEEHRNAQKSREWHINYEKVEMRVLRRLLRQKKAVSREDGGFGNG